MDKAWFEMREQIRRRVADAVWVPLELSLDRRSGDHGYLGFRSEYYGVHTLAVPIEQRVDGDRLSWSDQYHVGVYVEDGVYKPADVAPLYPSGGRGIALALRQQFDGAVPSTLHLNQDLVIALRLWREGDVWLRPREGFAEVARLLRGEDGREIGIEIRAEHLRDYLAARSMALRLCTYRSRCAVSEGTLHTGWTEEPVIEQVFAGRFEGRAPAIHEGGSPFGSTVAVFHMSRTDVDTGAEVPTMDPLSDEGVETSQRSFTREGRKLFRVEGEFWRDEWIEPAATSPRVRGDHVASDATFVVDGAGRRATADELNNEDIGKWLWFRPEIVNTILARRGGRLHWYTRDTGGLELSAGASVHFGLNECGLLNTYAYDVARLDEWERRIWAGFNVPPDGGVSLELTASQVYARPAETQAPEAFLAEALEAVDHEFKRRFGRSLVIEHAEKAEILSRTHRFRAVDLPGLLALAKDVARLTADSFDTKALKDALGLPKDDRTGSLKGLQSVLVGIIGADRARELMGPLVGVYDLRLGDAHLPSSKLNEALDLAELNGDIPVLQQARDLLHRVVTTLYTSAAVLAGQAVTPEQQARVATMDDRSQESN